MNLRFFSFQNKRARPFFRFFFCNSTPRELNNLNSPCIFHQVPSIGQVSRLRMKRVSETENKNISKIPKTRQNTAYSTSNSGFGTDPGYFDKLSESIDIKEMLGLTIREGKVFNNEGQYVLYIVANKNMKISKKLDLILEYLQRDEDDGKEIIIVSVGDSYQKSITVIEILKQKIKQKQKGRAGAFRNDAIAILPRSESLVIKGETVREDKLPFNYSQLNFLDFKIQEREFGDKARMDSNGEVYRENDLYDRGTIDSVLKVDKPVKQPVIYTYMLFHREQVTPMRYVKKISFLLSNGWSEQTQ